MIRARPLRESIYADGVSQSRDGSRDRQDEQDARKAREDFAMYAWLESNNLLPAPGRLPSAQAMLAWHEYLDNGKAPAMKTCTQCRECKPRTAFYFNGPNRCRSSACMDCARVRGRTRQAALRVARKSNGEQ